MYCFLVINLNKETFWIYMSVQYHNEYQHSVYTVHPHNGNQQESPMQVYDFSFYKQKGRYHYVSSFEIFMYK